MESSFSFDSVSSSADGFHLLALAQSGHILQWGTMAATMTRPASASSMMERARVVSELEGRNVVKVCCGCGNL